MDMNELKRLSGIPIVEAKQPKVDNKKVAGVEQQIKKAAAKNSSIFDDGKSVAVITYTADQDSYGFHIAPTNKEKVGQVIKNKSDPDSVVVKIVSESTDEQLSEAAFDSIAYGKATKDLVNATEALNSYASQIKGKGKFPPANASTRFANAVAEHKKIAAAIKVIKPLLAKFKD